MEKSELSLSLHFMFPRYSRFKAQALMWISACWSILVNPYLLPVLLGRDVPAEVPRVVNSLQFAEDIHVRRGVHVYKQPLSFRQKTFCSLSVFSLPLLRALTFCTLIHRSLWQILRH